MEKALEVLVVKIGLPRESIISFRPPWGFPWRLKTWRKVTALQRVLDELNLHLTLWSYDPKDWEINEGRNTPEKVSGKIADEFNGGIVLLHDIHTAVIPLTDILIGTAAREGISFITASEFRTIYSPHRSGL